MTTTLPPKALVRKLLIAEAVNHLIVTQRTANAEFWAQSTDAILAELNADITETLTMFAGNTALAEALNATQTTLNVLYENGSPVYPARAPTAPGRTDITFDGTEFVYVAPPEPEPIPEP